MLIRTYADIEKLEGEDALSEAERLLIENCRIGQPTVLGDGSLPEEPSAERTIRADLLRYLITGGCDDCRIHERGVSLNGAWVSGVLDLSFARAAGPVFMSACCLQFALVAERALFDMLVLRDCHLPELFAPGAVVRGGVFLERTKSRGEICFANAEINGPFDCRGADLQPAAGFALNLESSVVRGSVSLNELTCIGEISMSGAEVGGQLSLDGARLEAGGGDAFVAQHLLVRGGFFWRSLATVTGAVDLASAHVGDLVDDPESWEQVKSLRLAGMVYGELSGPLGLTFRKGWVRQGSNFNGQFYPQPYQHLAKFYRETGHRYEAREILIEKEREQRKAAKSGILVRLWDAAAEAVAGYGYKPWLSLWWLGGLVAIMMGMAQLTWTAGDFAPNSAVVLTSQDWKAIADGPSENPAADWTAPQAPGKDYETFYAFAYALDVVVPVLDLGQTDAWAPSPARGEWGYRLFYLQKIFIVLGWVVTAIAAAAISGMIRRDD